MNGLRSAIGFLTILPLAPSGAPGSLVSARGWFPLVGLLLGLILASLEILRMLMLQAGSSGWYGYAPLPVTYPVFLNYTILLWSVLLVVILVVLTRALHLDGFMDSCDALLGGFDRERRLAILRDPNVGAFAVIGVVCLLLIKVLIIAATTAFNCGAATWNLRNCHPKDGRSEYRCCFCSRASRAGRCC